MPTSHSDLHHFDVLIVGAGLSGIGAARHLQSRCPSKRFVILEARESIGGTWDLFRYPGIRSDSDMFTLGYSFKPWKDAKAIADGPSILKYVKETAREGGIDAQIRYRHRVVRASWSTPDALWTVEAERGEARELVRYTCNFLFMCSGYFSYAAGYAPQFPGSEQFQGRIVHPQKWTEDVDYAGKRVVVIGSGATAVTLVPEMAKLASHVTMLQRSPTYVISMPARDPIANLLRRLLPTKLAYAMIRWKNVGFGMLFFALSRHATGFIKGLLCARVKKHLGAEYDIDKHFKPRYDPWDQRLCLVPDGDLFKAIKAGSASVITDEIETFTPSGIRLKSGTTLEADLIVTATGLNLAILGDAQIAVDGRQVDLGRTLSYKGMMFGNVPNLASVFGYTNASWTLKADLIAKYVCRLLNYMDRNGLRQCTPRAADPGPDAAPFIDFSSGYVRRSIAKFPKQGTGAPWKAHQNYVRDLLNLRFGAVDDGAMQFSNPVAPELNVRADSLPQ